VLFKDSICGPFVILILSLLQPILFALHHSGIKLPLVTFILHWLFREKVENSEIIDLPEEHYHLGYNAM
jgi:hypothetical protein